jgi:undecaprenyl-diphosphatase
MEFSTEFKNKKYFYHKLIITLVFLILFIIAEIFFRNPLFNKSVELIEDFQLKTGKNFEYFMKTISNFAYAIFIFIIINYFTLPLSKQYIYIFTCILSFYIDNILKIIYRNPRPFFENKDIRKECDGGFGNPSGHAMLSSCSYLCFLQLICEEFNLNFILKIILFILVILIVILIGISRIFLGVHSINQIIYGYAIGFVCYFIVFHVFYLQRKSAKLFFYEFRMKIKNLIISIILIILISFLFIFGYSLNYNKYYEYSIFDCELKKERKFLNDGIFLGLIIVCLFGFYYGFVLISYFSEKYKNKEEYFNYFIRNSNKKIFGKIILIILLIFGSSPLILFLLIDEVNLAIAFIFKMIVPTSLCMFLNFGVVVVVYVKIKCANKNIYENEEKSFKYEFKQIQNDSNV